MRIAAYTHLHRARNPTGVGNHMIQMVQGLSRAPGVEVTVVAPRGQLDEAGRIPTQNPLAGITARGLPLGRRWLETMWERLDTPKLDHWCRGADWVYTPTEAYIAVRRPRLAVTVHDLHAFETNLPWSTTPGHRAFRRRWAAMFGPIIERADCILAASEFTRRRLVELLGAKDERIAVVGNGVDSAFFDAPAEVEPVGRHGGRYVVVIGGLTRRKGGDLVLRTAREMQRVVPDFRVIIAGTGEREFDGPASELPNIVCLGFVGTAQLNSSVERGRGDGVSLTVRGIWNAVGRGHGGRYPCHRVTLCCLARSGWGGGVVGRSREYERGGSSDQDVVG